MAELKEIDIQPFSGPVAATIRPPGSKSLTNRALLCAAMSNGPCLLSGALDSDDTRVMIDSLVKLGLEISFDHLAGNIQIQGCSGILPHPKGHLFVRNSGTSIRFLTAMLGIHGSQITLAGDPRMHERPIGDLAQALNQLGANVKTESPGGCPPVVIDSQRIGGGTVSVRGNISSQYLSGLMMAAPLTDHDMILKVDGQLVSIPYVQMTAKVMNSFGVECQIAPDHSQVSIAGRASYQSSDYDIEPDASAASYFFAVAAICGGSITVAGLGSESLQGDTAFAKCLEQAGCQVEFNRESISVTGPATRGIDIDMGDFSDTAQTLAVVALFLPQPTTIRGVAHNRVKETDRIGDLATELRKLGADVTETPDGMIITPPVCVGKELTGATIETYDDHRMAMSLALAGLKIPHVKILDPGCVSKTYPDFFADLEKVRP